MNVDCFFSILNRLGGEFYTGVPDSLLKPFLDALCDRYGVAGISGPAGGNGAAGSNGPAGLACRNGAEGSNEPSGPAGSNGAEGSNGPAGLAGGNRAANRHIVAANEGAAVGLAAGHYLAIGCPGVVYMQNSGLGNAVNPICSLLHSKVYAIPVVFVIGWRGEPGVKDESQHIFQGEITLKMLELLEIPYVVVDDGIDAEETVNIFNEHLGSGRSVAFVIRKGALEYDGGDTGGRLAFSGGNLMNTSSGLEPELTREAALEAILGLPDRAIYICTTGKLSREVYEIRERQGTGHGRDFLTVGSMGHSISIAQGIAVSRPGKRIICLDGDGAMLMHTGSLATGGLCRMKNLVHIVFNNGAHESVGGMPTAFLLLSPAETARALGYVKCIKLKSVDEITEAVDDILNTDGPVFIEIVCNAMSRDDLGRPLTSPQENKAELMTALTGEGE